MRIPVLLPIVLLSLLASPAEAILHRGDDASWPAEARAGGRLSLEQAVARVEKRYGGRAVRAEEHRERDRVVYRIRLLTADGRVVDVTVDPDSGEIR